jgi:hypothetical protein
MPRAGGLQQQAGDDAGAERGEAVGHREADPMPELAAIGAHDAGPHHAQSPEQQRDRAEQVEEEFHGFQQRRNVPAAHATSQKRNIIWRESGERESDTIQCAGARSESKGRDARVKPPA